MKLDTFLDEVPKLRDTARYQCLATRQAYYDGQQYKERTLDAGGYRKAMPGVFGSLTCSPAWSERDPGATIDLTAEAVGELTNWALGEDAWCGLAIPDDEAASDYLAATVRASSMPDACAAARDLGGALGAVAVSVGIRSGQWVIETHSARDTWVLEWADEPLHVPSVVAKVYQEEDPFARPGAEAAWVACIWTKTDYTVRRRVRRGAFSGAVLGEWTWEVVAQVVHKLGECPVIWCPQGPEGVGHDGVPDVPDAALKIVDAACELFAAADATTKRNADDTLVIREDPALNPGKVRKGSFHTIFARGGAEYLSQTGESARVSVELAEKRIVQFRKRAKVVIPTEEQMGAATSGESLRRQFQPMTRQAGRLRKQYERRLIVPLCRMMLRIARSVGARGEGIVLPPRVEEIDGKPVVTVRSPGKSENIEVTWPDPFQPTSADTAASVAAASAGTGAKQIMSRRTAIKMIAKAGVPIDSVDQELERIEEDEEASAEREAKAMNAGAPPPGESGPVDDEEPEEGEKDEAAE